MRKRAIRMTDRAGRWFISGLRAKSDTLLQLGRTGPGDGAEVPANALMLSALKDAFGGAFAAVRFLGGRCTSEKQAAPLKYWPTSAHEEASSLHRIPA